MNTVIIQKNNFEYPRNKVLVKCIKKIDPESVENFFEMNIFTKLTTLWKTKKIIFIWPAQKLIFWIIAAKLMGKEVIVDMFNFYFETFVEDRGLLKKHSLKAYVYLLLDYSCIKLADKVIVDTKEHGQYMTKLYGEVNYFVFPVIVDDKMIDTIIADHRLLKEGFNVLYSGKFIPLHGVEKIVEAANLLKNRPINFYLQGSGQTRGKIEAMVNSLGLNEKIKFIDRLPYEEMLALMKASDVCLGVFGDSEKTKRVVPNKVLEALFCGRPVITLSTITMKKLSGINGVFLVEDVQQLAQTIVGLFNETQKVNYFINVMPPANFDLNSGVNILKQNLYEN